MKIPYISNEWRILFKPEKYGNYVNDHTIVKGSDGDWHLYGITTCGWTDKPVPHKGCVSIATLEWK